MNNLVKSNTLFDTHSWLPHPHLLCFLTLFHLLLRFRKLTLLSLSLACSLVLIPHILRHLTLVSSILFSHLLPRLLIFPFGSFLGYEFYQAAPTLKTKILLHVLSPIQAFIHSFLPMIVMSAKCVVSHLILTTSTYYRYSHYPHYTDH